MNFPFGEMLRKLRKEKGVSQNQLAIQMHVTHSTIARWENGRRLPDVSMIARLATVLGVSIDTLMSSAAGESKNNESLSIIIVDDNKIDISESVFVLEEVMPHATIMGFNRRSEAIEYAKTNRIDLAFLDIEMGTASGFEFCRELLEISPFTKVVYLTAYPDYSLDAWGPNACGFMVKPLTPESVRTQLEKLRSLFSMGGS